MTYICIACTTHSAPIIVHEGSYIFFLLLSKMRTCPLLLCLSGDMTHRLKRQELPWIPCVLLSWRIYELYLNIEQCMTGNNIFIYYQIYFLLEVKHYFAYQAYSLTNNIFVQGKIYILLYILCASHQYSISMQEYVLLNQLRIHACVLWLKKYTFIVKLDGNTL